MIAVECCFLSIEKSKELKLETSFGLNSGGAHRISKQCGGGFEIIAKILNSLKKMVMWPEFGANR